MELKELFKFRDELPTYLFSPTKSKYYNEDKIFIEAPEPFQISFLVEEGINTFKEFYDNYPIHSDYRVEPQHQCNPIFLILGYEGEGSYVSKTYINDVGQFVVEFKTRLFGLPEWMTEKQPYDFKPFDMPFRILKKGSKIHTYYGMELEVISELDTQELQRIVTQVEPKQEPFFYCKHDGSINDSDFYDKSVFEIVTFPCSYRYLRKAFRIFFKKLDKLDKLHLVNTNSNCGIHVHFTKDTVKKTNRYGTSTTLTNKKFQLFWNTHNVSGKTLVEKLGKRKFNYYSKPADMFYGRNKVYKLRNNVDSQFDYDAKYSCCRNTNKTTEVRVFKGDFRLQHILYCLETVAFTYELADSTPISYFDNKKIVSHFETTLRNTNKYKILKEDYFQCA
jgi:hypothetical protein